MTTLSILTSLLLQTPGAECVVHDDCDLAACEYCGDAGTCTTCPSAEDSATCEQHLCVDRANLPFEGGGSGLVCTGIEPVGASAPKSPLAELCGASADPAGFAFVLPIEPIGGGPRSFLLCGFGGELECVGPVSQGLLDDFIGPGFCAATP